MSEVQENVVADESGLGGPRPEGGAIAERPASRGSLPSLRLGVWLPPLIAFAALATAWELYARSHPFVIPTIEDLWGTLRAVSYTHLTLPTICSV